MGSGVREAATGRRLSKLTPAKEFKASDPVRGKGNELAVGNGDDDDDDNTAGSGPIGALLGGPDPVGNDVRGSNDGSQRGPMMKALYPALGL